MGSFELARFHDAEALAQAAAKAWLDEVQAARSEPYCVALAGGRIAGRFFAAVSSLAKGRQLPSAVHFFWGDERCVPPDDRESNYRLARVAFLQPLAIPEGQIHRVRGEAPPDEAAAVAAAELVRLAPERTNGQPVLDLALLGMGEDGHVASLFPDEPEAAMSNQAVYRAVIGPKPPPQRITLGYPALAAARQVWVLASGDGKQEALRKSLEPGGRTPLGRLLGLRTQTRILTELSVG